MVLMLCIGLPLSMIHISRRVRAQCCNEADRCQALPAVDVVAAAVLCFRPRFRDLHFRTDFFIKFVPRSHKNHCVQCGISPFTDLSVYSRQKAAGGKVVRVCSAMF